MTDEVKKILADSLLTSEDQELWLKYLEWAPPFLSERFVELFKDTISDLPETTVRLRQRIAASDDADLLQVILDKELETLKAFFNK